MTDALFVYGTLRGECDNPHAGLLRQEADSLGPAKVRGSLFRVATYPGYKPEPDGVVYGELWHLPNPGPTLAVLDNYEGPEYARVAVEILDAAPHLPSTAWIYLYLADVDPGRRIASGDFLAP